MSTTPHFKLTVCKHFLFSYDNVNFISDISWCSVRYFTRCNKQQLLFLSTKGKWFTFLERKRKNENALVSLSIVQKWLSYFKSGHSWIYSIAFSLRTDDMCMRLHTNQLADDAKIDGDTSRFQFMWNGKDIRRREMTVHAWFTRWPLYRRSTNKQHTNLKTHQRSAIYYVGKLPAPKKLFWNLCRARAHCQ